MKTNFYGDSYMFNASFVDAAAQINGTLSVFSSDPMSSSPLSCTYSAN
jgi:hypothetical protein